MVCDFSGYERENNLVLHTSAEHKVSTGPMHQRHCDISIKSSLPQRQFFTDQNRSMVRLLVFIPALKPS